VCVHCSELVLSAILSGRHTVVRSPPVEGGASITRALTGPGCGCGQIQRKARRKNQGELVRQLDSALPDTFRRGVSFNGAGGRALGMAGRSLHDVLEDTVMVLAWLSSPRNPASQREGGDQGSSQMVADVGPLMRDFMASTGKNALDISADANLFVVSAGLRDRGSRRKATQNRVKDITSEGVRKTSSTGASTPRPPAPRAMAAGSPQTIPSPPQRPSVPATQAEEGPASTSANTSPFLVKMSRDSLALAPLVLEKSEHTRLPPIRIISTHSGYVKAEHAAQKLPVTCKTEQSQAELLQELSQAPAAVHLREQALLLLLLHHSPTLLSWPSLCPGV
jgi:hypothetical protein